MAKKLDEEMLEEINENLADIAAVLADLVNEMIEVRTTLQFIGIPLISDMILKYKPESKEQLEPIISELLSGLEQMKIEEPGEEE